MNIHEYCNENTLHNMYIIVLVLVVKFIELHKYNTYNLRINKKADEIKKMITKKGIASLPKLTKLYNEGIQHLKEHGNSVIVTTDIGNKLILYRKRLIEWTLSGNFNTEYKSFKKYYKNKYGHKHYPKSAEYARISLKRHGIYNGVEEIVKLMSVYYVLNAPQAATESKQKKLMTRDQDRYHKERGRMEMECVSADGISKHHNNEKTVMKVAFKCVESGKNPFTNSSIKDISPVMDRRVAATKEYVSTIPDTVIAV